MNAHYVPQVDINLRLQNGEQWQQAANEGYGRNWRDNQEDDQQPRLKDDPWRPVPHQENTSCHNWQDGNKGGPYKQDQHWKLAAGTKVKANPKYVVACHYNQSGKCTHGDRCRYRYVPLSFVSKEDL